jgi:hypothetical protein
VEVSGGTVEPVLVHAGRTSTDDIEVDYPAVDLSGKCSAATLAETINRLAGDAQGPTVVLLEYSGYGYAQRGAPLWLVRGVRRVCGEDGVPLITMFHEISASGPIWSSAFWLSRLQRYVAQELARQSRQGCSNSLNSVQWLRARSSLSVGHCPVFSNVGEPETLSSHADRESFAVVFGGTGKQALYRNHGANLADLLHSLGIEKLVDIGPSPPESLVSVLSDVDVVREGKMPRTSVSQRLREARFGVLCRNPKVLTKSGGLAAYLAHGVPSVVALRDSTEENPYLTDGIHYLSLQRALTEAATSSKWKEVGTNGWKWYNQHAHSRQVASTFFDLISAVAR